MKKITLFFVFAILGAFTFSSYAQTLNQAANWPNAGWALSGTYTAGGLLSDPTGTDSTLTWDDDAAGNGGVDAIQATSPVIDLTAASGAGETWITVSGDYAYRELGGDILNIETYDADAMTWSVLETLSGNSTDTGYQTCAGTAPYTTATLNIAGFTATQLSGFQYRISYDDAGGWQWGFCVTSPTITSAAPPSCLDPSALTATSITDASADLGWTENGTATAWNIELVDITAAGAQTMTATSSGVTNPFNLTGLTADNDYAFYVQADCGVGGTSAWVGPFAFTTACAATAAPYTEDFETFVTANDIAFGAENCWTGTGGAYFWESAPGSDFGSGGTGPAPSITTGNYFYTEASTGASGDITDLVSPLVDLTALTAPALTFNYHMFGGQIGTLNVIVNGTTSVWTLSGQQQTTETTPWELAVVDLAAYAGQSISVTFRATSAGTFAGDIAIDNVSFTELPACLTPNALTATSITDDSASLGFTENGTATAWDIELVDVTAAGIATGTGTPTATGVTNPYAATGLTQNNDYAFYVRADCGGGTTSNWAGPFAFTTLETCPIPSALNATNIFETTADLGWTENGTATAWNIELVDITAGGVVTGTATASGVTNPYSATGLTGDNSYSFYVQADCGVDGASAWAGPFAFATPYVAVAPDCTNGIFKDSGGASGDYSSGENITYTITPDVMGNVVSVDFTSFSVENNGTGCWDGLTIYDGPDATATTIDPPAGGTIWCWDENDAPAVGSGDLEGMTITSSHPSGALTFVFTSDGSAVRDGWEAIVTCSAPAPANDDCADAEAITLGTAFSGDTSNATDSGIAASSCGATGGDQDVWYSFVAPVSTIVSLTTTADFVAIYDSCGGTEVACLANGEQSPALMAGNTYYARVYNDGLAVSKVAGPFTATFAEASLSTQDFDNGLAFSYYPNPVKNTLTLNAQQAISNVAIFNMLGQEVIRTAPNAVSNAIDMSNLQSGAYFVQVTIGATVETVRVIKN